VTLAAVQISEEEFALFNEFLAKEFGLVSPSHKRDMLQTKLNPRLLHHRFRSFAEYYTYLQFDGNGERRELVRAITNNESYFFRETHQFDALLDGALPELKTAASDRRKIRVLSVGCSSGEEPYSLSIHFRDNQYRMFGYDVEIDAFDLDDSRIAIAVAAEYGDSSMRGATAEQMQKYFRVERGRYRLKPMYVAGTSFRIANLLDPAAYRGTYDVMFCRNVLIYFSEETMRSAVGCFARALRPGGYLFLGHSESIIGMSSLFEPVRLGNCIAYRRICAAGGPE
jgi:chemotaxis protein methyltransferase CheR